MRVHTGVVISMALIGIGALVACNLPAIAAGGLLYPGRRGTLPARPGNCEERDFAGDGLTLRGWHCRAAEPTRATVIYLHGTADNRGSSVGIIHRFAPLGVDVIAYDSRRHGQSEGDVCTYGFFEKRDLRRIIDSVRADPVVLFGTSLGAAVALQEAAEDSRVAGIIAVEVFSDLRTVVRERAPGFLSDSTIEQAFQIAERRGQFKVDEVSPVKAARSVHVPVLLVHGAKDVDTPPAHSERVFAALAGPKRLVLVPAARHNESLSGPDVWTEIGGWLERVLETARRGRD